MFEQSEMDRVIERSESPDGLEQFAVNVASRSPKHALAARRRAVELRAATHDAETAVDRECLEAVYAYERAESQLRGKKFHASWAMIKRLGAVPAVETIVKRPAEKVGYRTLVDLGLGDKAFEAVVLRHEALFSPEAVKTSRNRLRKWGVPAAESPA